MKSRYASAVTTVCALAALCTTVTAGTGTAVGAPCPPAPASDTSTPSGWIGYLAAHPDDYGLVVTTDGRVTLSHDPDRRLPTASASKLIDLAAYARAVASGRVNPAQTVSVDEWERWYVPIDGGAHVEALKYLNLPPLTGIPGVARPKSLRVTLAQLADVMIRFSDSAAPDTLRAVLGDTRLTAVMREYGMPGPPPLNAGLYLGLIDPSLTTQAAQQVAGRRYHDDAAYRAAAFTVAGRLATTPSAAQIDRTYSQSTRALNALMRGVATGSFGPGSDLARAALEYQGPGPDGSVIGFKGGSLVAPTNSVLTENFELRSPSGTVSTATLMVHRMSQSDYERSDHADQPLLVAAMTDAATVRVLRCATSGAGRPH